MSAIDTQNAKQIRDPMDVLITLTLDNTEISMAYSGYSSTAKVADGVLDKKDWPMRGLADLQADGFPLDGTHVLYDYSTSPSQTNGKLGVRGHVGQSVSVTATGDGTIASIGIDVTGAASVTLNGETTEITGSAVSLQLLDTTAALTFAPASETARIEVVNIFPETDFYITNDNLIKATVSLRSDLSIVDPTLPESELNVEVYHDIDISEAVAQIPDDTPITYQAGYPGDMSPVRKFYVAGQVTWADNVLAIHAVDAVHFLEKSLPSAVRLKDSYQLGETLKWMLEDVGIDAQREPIRSNFSAENRVAVFEKQSYRDFIKHVQWLLNVPGENINLHPAYVDAGIPKLRYSLPQPLWRIREEDCGECKKSVEKVYDGAIYETYNHNLTDFTAFGPVGAYDWYKDNGIFLNIDEYTLSYAASLTNEEWNRATEYGWWSSTGATAIAPPSTAGKTGMYQLITLVPFGAAIIFDNSIPNRAVRSNVEEAFTQIIPWDCYYSPGAFDHNYWGNIRSMADMWRFLTEINIFERGLTNFSGSLWGLKLQKSPEKIEINAESGNALRLNVETVWGQLYKDSNALVRIFPNKGIEWLLSRSNISGAFTWKGDPRIQPRDVVEWERTDDTTEVITLETITLTHEKGGTSAECTYWKGIV